MKIKNMITINKIIIDIMEITTKLTYRGYKIRKNEISEKKLREIKDELTVSPNKAMGETESFELYTDTENYIIVPKYYGIKEFGPPKIVNLSSIDRDIKFEGNLREYQKEIVEKCLTKIRKTGGTLLSVGCGRGKTIMALKIIAELKKKTLILVNKTCLLDQWKERIKEFMMDDIKVGILQRDKCEIEGNDIVIGMIHSVSKGKYDINLMREFGFIISDESHHIASRVFSKSLRQVTTEYTLALTATPKREDGLIRVMYWYLGMESYKEGLRTNNQVVVKTFRYIATNDPTYKEEQVYYQRKMQPSHTKMVNNIIKTKSRNDHVINIIDQLRKDPDRKILVLSGRIDQLEEMKKEIDARIKKDIKDKVIERGEINTYMYIGKTKKEERNEAEKYADILFGSYTLADEGLDIAHLNTIVMCTPKKDIIQAVGRVMRKILEDGDTRPLIIDVIDQLSIYPYQYKKRENVYTKSNYKKEYYYLINEKIVSQKEFNSRVFQEDYGSEMKYKTYEEILKVEPVEIQNEKEEEKTKNDDINNDQSYKKQNMGKINPNIFKRKNTLL